MWFNSVVVKKNLLASIWFLKKQIYCMIIRMCIFFVGLFQNCLHGLIVGYNFKYDIWNAISHKPLKSI